MSINRHSDGKRWVVEYYAPDGKRKRPFFNTQREAKEFLATVETHKRGGTYVDPSVSKGVMFSALWERWMQRVEIKGARGKQPARPMTLDDYRFNYEHYLKGHWQYRPLSSITRAEVEQWVDTLTTPQGVPALAYGLERAVKNFTGRLIMPLPRDCFQAIPPKTGQERLLPRQRLRQPRHKAG